MSDSAISIDEYNRLSTLFIATDTDGDNVVTDKDLFIVKGNNSPRATWQDVQKDVEAVRFQSQAEQFATNSGPQNGKIARLILNKIIPNATIVAAKDRELIISGTNIKLPNGLTLTNGTVHFKDGRFFTTAKDKTVINGVGVISLTTDPNPIYLYADPKRIPTSRNNADKYVLFEQSSLTVSSVAVVFNPGNPYTDVIYNQYLAIELPHGQVILSFSKEIPPKLSLAIKTRDHIISVRTGPWNLSIVDNEFIGLGRYVTSAQSVPLKIEFQDENKTAKPLRERADNPDPSKPRLFVANYNNLSFSDSRVLAEVETFPNAVVVRKVNKNLNFSDYAFRAKSLVPYMKFSIPLVHERHGQTHAELVDILSTCTPEMLAETSEINLHPLPKLRKICKSSDADGCTYDNQKSIHVESKSGDINPATVKHELAHKLTNRHGKKLKNKWEKITRVRNYGKNVNFNKEGNPISWKNVKPGESSTGPRNGFIGPYGAKDYHEDISTFVEKVDTPYFFAQLIKRNSTQYDVRYEQKLGLLLEFKYITQEQYDKVMKYAA